MNQQDTRKVFREITQISINTVSKNLNKEQIENALIRSLNGLSLSLCFHRISESPKETTEDPLCITRRNLDSILLSLSKVKAKGDMEDIFITFDDGYQESLRYIEQTKNRHQNLKWIYFICPEKSSLRRKFLWDNKNAPSQLASTDECLESCSKYGVEIGNHTNTHRSISSLTDEELTEEINNSIKTLKKANIIHHHFAYPYGYPGKHFTAEQTEKIIQIYKKNDITPEIWSTEPYPFKTNDPKKEKPRIAILGTDSVTTSLSKILMQSLKLRIKHITEKAASR